MKLVIGNKNYSTWSMRPWLLMSAFNLDFEEIKVSLKLESMDERLGEYSPTHKIPILMDDEITLWESLAICEYVSEKYLDDKGWPEDRVLRAEARALCSEMNSGFMALRNEMPMNCRAKRKITLSTEAAVDIARIDEIWSTYSQKTVDKGQWLMGEFSIADCFFAPVASRFQTYGVVLSSAAQQYATQLLAHQSVRHWVEAGLLETEILEQDEAGVDV
ncbi:MAG TPA: glutathione S-transferase family protein [Thiotrichaceae bacterium]|nr:glutathione S-transferase family protein [Thiotrichaceae bacterium]